MSLLKILVVDDHKMIRDGIKSMLQEENEYLIVGEASNGKQALNILKDTDIDVVIMDINMPEMNGYEAVKVLRSKLETASIPIMMLTGKSDVESEIKGLDIGADDYMGKPFDSGRLLARVKMLIRKSYA